MNISLYDIVDSYSSKEILSQLDSLTDTEEINVHINSPGGSVFHGFAIYNRLRGLPNKVNTFIDGLAASIASVIAMAGNRVYMSEASRLMIHNPSTAIQGDSEDLEKAAETLKSLEKTLINIYQQKTKLPKKTIKVLLDNETFMNADEAQKSGFVDEIVQPVKAVAILENKDMSNLSELLTKAQNFIKGSDEDNEIKRKAEEEAKIAAEAKANSDDPAKLLTKDLVDLKAFTEFHTAQMEFNEAFMKYVEDQPTAEKIYEDIEKNVSLALAKALSKIKTTGNPPTLEEIQSPEAESNSPYFDMNAFKARQEEILEKNNR